MNKNSTGTHLSYLEGKSSNPLLALFPSVGDLSTLSRHYYFLSESLADLTNKQQETDKDDSTADTLRRTSEELMLNQVLQWLLLDSKQE